jgi:hypothetical protein
MEMGLLTKRKWRNSCNVTYLAIVEFHYSPLNAEEVDEIMASCDKNKDGKIDFNEFLSAMMG